MYALPSFTNLPVSWGKKKERGGKEKIRDQQCSLIVNVMHAPGGLKQGFAQSTEVPPAALPSAVGMAAGHLERGIAQEPLAAFSSK